MVRKCIYCGAETDLSESDIIPDALTNARILNKNVCRIAHNNRFSDLFESHVISALSFITNELDVKSHKGKQYAAYDATVTIEGESYITSLSSDKAIFDGRVLKSPDKKHMISSYEKMVRIAKDPNLVQPLDVNQIEIEKSVTINTSIYFDTSMYRMVAKIAYEWYCAKNNVNGCHPEFEKIVSYITTGTGDCPVSIIQTDQIYDLLSEQFNLGSHILFAYESESGQIEVVVFLFGILMYRVVVASRKPTCCSKNFLFVELRTDASRKTVEHDSRSAAEAYFQNCLNPEQCVTFGAVNGVKLMVPKSLDNLSDLVLYPLILNAMKCFEGIRTDTQSPNETINRILFKQIQKITQASLLHKKSVKRFVGEYFNAGHEPIRLNPTFSNKKVTVLLYAVFVIGQSGRETLNDFEFQRLMKEKFAANGDGEVTITDELAIKLKQEMLQTPGYSEILELGANLIKEWA